MTVELEEITSEEGFRAAHAVMSELRPHLDEPAYMELAEQMRPQGYRLFGARSEGRIAALAGVGFGINLYYGRYMWVYELITTSDARSRGHGKALLDHLEKLARAEGCDTIALSSGLARKDAHRFYEDKAGFRRSAYVFQKDLGEQPFMPPPKPD